MSHRQIVKELQERARSNYVICDSVRNYAGAVRSEPDISDKLANAMITTYRSAKPEAKARLSREITRRRLERLGRLRTENAYVSNYLRSVT